jgi:transketolase
MRNYRNDRYIFYAHWINDRVHLWILDLLLSSFMTPKHDSIRGWFAAALHKEMEKDERIWLIVADLGYKMWDDIRDDFPERFINVGASECAAVGAGVGLALSGKIPFVYSITTFLTYRPFEWIRNYLDHEQIPVRLIGSGMNDDYKHDGVSHQPYEVREVLATLPNIIQHYPVTKEEVPVDLEVMLRMNKPAFMCLRR